ncbi:MAG TPA: ABC transporter ATP-binding protein [Anaerolineales bacterium]|nr:ABC transporter ATP-binding protein [Anaerolineales bacterium]
MNANGKVSIVDLQSLVSENKLVGLWRLTKGFRVRYIGATLSIGMAALMKSATYILLGLYVDRVLAEERYELLPYVALAFILIAVVEGGFTFLSGRLAALTAEGIALRLRNYLYDHIQRLTFAYHDITPTGELIQRATSDVDAIRRFYAEQAIGLGRILLLFLVNFTAILILNWQLALFSIIAVPVITVLSIFFFRRIFKAYDAYQDQDAVVSTTLQENLSGIRVVKSFARQPYEMDKFDRENEKKYRLGRRLVMIHSTYWPITDIIAGVQMIAGFLFAALMAINGTITIGTYLAYVGMVIWIIWPMRNLGRLIVQMSTASVSYGRVVTVLSEKREPLTSGSYEPEGNVRGEIRFEGVSFEYETDAPVLKEITFLANPGEVIALMGSTGSGKSSLVNLLPRFYGYTSGILTLDGVELERYPRRYLRSQIGIVEQEPFLFSRTIRENITYGVDREVSDEEVERAAQAAEIHEVILEFPNGYNTLVGERGVTLSGGQKQRVAIARTLLKDPRILILDDATSSVDTETEARIREALRKLMIGRTTFIIAHRVQTAMDADLILLLDKGRIIERGTHEELYEKGGLYRRIFDLQALIEDELQAELEAAQAVGL